jgi:hydroxymethylbilane synthase
MSNSRTPQNRTETVLRVGSRGSKLARAQADLVRQQLQAGAAIATILVTITTTGDRVKDRPLAEIGGNKGLFAKELEDALLRGSIDLAVHSLKDLPVEIPNGLRIVATPRRDDPADAFLSNIADRLHDLPKGARLGTSSVRRTAQIARRRPDLEIVPLRGNVDTRIAKLDSGQVDGMVLALAGLKRLNLKERATEILDPEEWLPALAQGALAIEMREQHTNCKAVSGALHDAPSGIALACERAFQAALDGSCRSPIAGLAKIENDHLRFRGEVLAPDGSASEEIVFTMMLRSDPEREAAQAGREAGLELRARTIPWLAL